MKKIHVPVCIQEVFWKKMYSTFFPTDPVTKEVLIPEFVTRYQPCSRIQIAEGQRDNFIIGIGTTNKEINVVQPMQVPEFYPTIDQFSKLDEFIEFCGKNGGEVIGAAKINPPSCWIANASGYRNLKFMLKEPLDQSFSQVTDSNGHVTENCFTVTNVFESNTSWKKFQDKVIQKYGEELNTEGNTDDLYWGNMQDGSSAFYGSDQNGSLFDKKQTVWNLTKVKNLLDSLNPKIKGLNSPYLYFGSWMTTFPWHTEDFDLLSLNYLHFGKPKIWYIISEMYANNFEELGKQLFVKEDGECSNIMRHKYAIINPKTIVENQIPVTRVEQHENQFIITFARAYHSGYNSGFNCAEALNYANKKWIKFGRKYETNTNRSCFYCSTKIKNIMNNF